MDQNQITEIIKANQALPYEEVKRKALESGLSDRQFEHAWRKAKINDSSLDHDARIAQIVTEMETLGKKSKNAQQWKDYFKSKGYMDDEADIGYVLAGIKIKANPFSSWYLPAMLAGVIILLTVLLPIPGFPRLLQGIITAIICFGTLYLFLYFSQFNDH
jgi:hypothetical protein